MSLPSPAIAQQGGDIDVDQLYRRIALLESRSQDPSSVAITGGRIADLLGGKLRRLAAAAAVSNALTNPPLTLAPAWVAGTVYKVGQVVTNGGNQYICYTPGTAAGSGGPSGTGAALITDNTVSWHYYGVARIASNSVLAPTFTTQVTSTPSGLSNVVLPVTSPQSFLFAGGPATAASFNWVKFPTVTTNSGNVTATQSSFGWSVTFETDAPKFAFATSNGTVPSRFIIDGQYYYDGGDSDNSGNPYWRICDYSGNRKTRRVTLEGAGNLQFAGVAVDSQSQVWAPNIDVVKVAVLGSSIEAGGNSYPIVNSQAWCFQVGKLLGWADVRNLGLGGTGYTVANGAYTYAGHLSDATSFSPDIVIVGGPINDTAGAALQAAALSLYQQIRAALPNAIIIVGGTFPANSGPDAAHLATEANIAAAVTAFGDPYTFFVPISNDPAGAWISGTGKVTATSGTGNADVYISADGAHPTQGGIDYEARRWAAAIRQKVLAAFI